MPQIGQFMRGKSDFTGRVHTLTLVCELTIVPAEHSDAENAPDYRVHHGADDGPEIGAAWKRTGEKAGEYLSVLLDDPALPHPIRANLFQNGDDTTSWSLHWSRATSGAEAMRSRVVPALESLIPLFAERSAHPVVPLGDQAAGARSEGQGRPSAGAWRIPLTAPSTLAGWRRSGDRARWRYSLLLLARALSFGGGSGIAIAESAPVTHPVAAHSHAAYIAEASQRFGIPELWIHAVLRAESAGDVRAISSTGAMGLMQVMPDTWAGLRVRYRLGRDPYDPRDNILAGTAYLREMWNRYGNVAAMLAAYNAGPGRYDEYLATGRTLPAETRAYVAALAPVLGGAVASDAGASAPPPPPDWREAPLFVTRPADVRAVTAPPSEVHSDDARAAVPARDSEHTEPETGSLFVARADDGRTP